MFKRVLIGIATASALAAGMLALPGAASADTLGPGFHSGGTYGSTARVWFGDYGEQHRYYEHRHEEHAFRGRAEFRRHYRRGHDFRRDHRWGGAYRRGDTRYRHDHAHQWRHAHAYHRDDQDRDRR